MSDSPLQYGSDIRRPADLPDLRLWLIDMWREGHIFDEVATLMNLNPGLIRTDSESARRTAEWAKRYPDPTVADAIHDPAIEYMPMEGKFDFRALSEARLYYVTADMARLIEAAASSLPATTLTPDIVPCPAGLIFFEEMLHGKSATTLFEAETGGTLMIRMILWGTAVLPPHAEENIGIATYSELETGSIFPCGRTDWIWGKDTDEPTDEGLHSLTDSELRILSMAEDRRWMATFWLLLSQGGIANEVEVRPQRPAVRRSERQNVTSTVRIVNVHSRKSASADGEHREVEWSHRWIVGGDTGGFWRQQAYGPGHSLRRPTFIAPFVKGPPDKPLIVKDTVHVLKDEG